MENRTITFHVHLPANIEKLGHPSVTGEKELGEWKKPMMKLHRPFLKDHPTYWKSNPIVISNGRPLRYAYTIQVPSSLILLEDEKVLYEGNVNMEECRFLGKEENQYDIWINGKHSDLLKYQTNNDVSDFVFVDLIYNNITADNLSESVLEYQRLLTLYKKLTIKFSGYEYMTKNLNENSLREQQLFLCLLLGYHISKERHPYKLPASFRSDILLEALLDYRKNIFLPDINKFIIMAVLCLIQHNALQSKLDWLVIFTIVKEIDSEYSFLEHLQNLKYDGKYLEKIKAHIYNIEFENQVKIIQWLIQLCQNMESLFEVWNMLLIRNKQISQYFIYGVQEIISNNDANVLMNNFSKIPKEFRDRVSFTFRKRVTCLLKNPDNPWTDSNASALRVLFQEDDLNWNNDNTMTSLELISQYHSLELLKIFPEILHDLFHRGFLSTKEKKISIICNSWFKLLLFKLGIKKSSSNESKYVITIFQQLDYIYPLLGQRINIWKDLSAIAIDKVKGYSESCILGATKSIMDIKEQEIKRLFIGIAKDSLSQTVQQINDQLMNKIFIICGYPDKIDGTIKTLNVPNTICEDILCHIMFTLQSQLPKYSPSEQHLSILKSSKFWTVILSATGSVEKLYANSYLQCIQMSIAELNRLLLEKTIDLQLLQQILEYSDEILLQHFAILKKDDTIVTKDDNAILRILYDDYVLQLDQLLKFYKEFCSAPKVIDVENYIHELQSKQNSDKVMLKEVLVAEVLEYWEFHEKTLDSAVHCYEFNQSQTFRNIFEACIRENAAATNVEYIAQKLIPMVYEQYDVMCKKYRTWEKVSCSEALLFWKNVKNVTAEFDLVKELGPYKNTKLIQSLEQLSNYPQWTEKLEQLEKIENFLQIQHNENYWLSKSINILKDDDCLKLGQVNQLFSYFEGNLQIDQNCWNLIKELSSAEDLLDFLKIISEKDIKNLINNIDDHSDDILIQEDTILSLIHVKKLLLPIIKEHKGDTIADFLEKLQNITKNSTLADKISSCNSSMMVLRNMYYNILNRDQDTKEKVKNAVLNGTYIFVCDEKKDKCLIKLKYPSLTKDIYNQNEILDLRKKALLIAKSKTPENMNDFVELVDVAQEIINVVTILKKRGHFYYQKFEKKVKGIENMRELLNLLNCDLEKWNNTVNQVQNHCYYLTFFTARHILAFYDYFTPGKLDEENEEMCKMLIKFVSNNASHDIEEMSRELHDYFGILREIGNKLETIFENIPKQRRKLEITQRHEIPDNVNKDGLFVATCNDKLLLPNIIMSLYANDGYYPEPWQLLICTSSTTMEELAIFIKRCFFASDNGYNNYLFCIANLELLDFELQYNLVNHIKEAQVEYRNENYLLALLCCRELGLSQYILDQHSFEVREINELDTETMQEIYQELCPNVSCVSSDLSGQGKTEWIKEVSFSKRKIPHRFLISDGMNLEYLVNKLKKCKLKHIESLHINILSADYPEDVNLFLFELLTLKIVSYNDIIVSIPETFIYIEIASSVKQQLLNNIPMLRVLPFNKHLSWNIENFRVSLETTSPIQVVCHYLNLYDHGMIDTQEIFFNTSKAIKHPLSAELCQNLIMKYFLNKNEKNELSFRQIEIFVNVLADQLIRLSSHQYFMINDLKEENTRATILKLLIEVSKDFAIRSIETKAVKLESTAIEENETNLDFISQWNVSNHVILFSNFQTSDSCTVLYHDKNKVPENIKLLLKSQAIGDPKCWKLDDYNTMSANEILTKLEGMARMSMHKLSLPEYVISSDNLIKMALILLRTRTNIPVILCGEAGCGKTSLITYLALIAEVSFQTLKLHAGIEEETIILFMTEALKKTEKGEIWILFDEINTCNHLGLLADLISNRIFQNKPIHPNVRLLATCNPYRFRTQNEIANIEKYKERSDLIYQTKPLPDQILDYIWDYDVLNPQDEHIYIRIMVKNELKELAHPVFSELLFASQQFIRKFEKPHSVSLRDVKRAITLAKFFHNSLNNRPAYKKGHKYPPPDNPTTMTRSFVLALSLCYHSRLYEQDLRKQYCHEIGQIFQIHKIYLGEKTFNRIIREEQDDYINRMQLPSDIAKNEVLLDNVLSMIVCILTKIPIFVIGETGSSKSLAIRLISSNLRGFESNDDYFKSLPKVYIVPYLCSSSSTSNGIIKIFEKANKYQETSSAQFPVINVVLLNNVGFAESNPSNPLKVLHSLLEPSYPATEPTVSFIGMSNWRLDISKSSRALLVQRPQFDLEDLVDIAEHLLINKVIKRPNQINILESLAKSYLYYDQHGQNLPNFYGLRDYYSLIKRLSLSNLSPENTQMALARNFGGTENYAKTWEKYFVNIVKIFKNQWAFEPIQLIKSNLEDPDARHLMVIGKYETTLNLLIDQLKTRHMDPLVIIGSQFPDECDDYYYGVLSRITTCVETGRPLILTDLETIYANLYDVLDLNHIVVGSKENAKYLSRIALGEYDNPMFYVSPNFKCIIVIDENNICSTDPSLLNRFEKQKLSINDVLNKKQQLLIQQLKDWTERMHTFGNDPINQLSTIFVGFDKDETLQNLVFNITKSYPHADDDRILERCKFNLAAVATPDGIVKAERSALGRDEIIILKNFYLQQHSDSLSDYLESLFNQQDSEEHLFIVNTFSNINTNAESCLDGLVRCQVYKLSIFRTEAQLSIVIKDFFLKSTDQILFLQCEDTAVNTRYMKLTKYIIEQSRREFLLKKEQLKTNVPMKFVCIIHHIQRDSEQNLISSNFTTGWKHITIESLEQHNIPLCDLLDKSLHDIIESSKLFGEIVNSTMPFEIFLKDELLWCFSCIEYRNSNQAHISTLSKEILHNTDFVQCIKTKTFKWIFENYKDWQFEVARNKDYLNQFTCFSLALQNYIKLIIKQTMAKILYSLEKLSAATTFFKIENNKANEMKTELSNLWKQFVMDNTIINLNNLPEAMPSRYVMSCSTINDLEFPFSYYFMNQINFYKIHYYEELDILRQDLDNIDKETKELHEELIEDHIEDFKKNLISIKPNFINLQNYSKFYYNDFIKILSSSFANCKKELDIVFKHLNGDRIVDDPFLLHIYWWKYADNILIQLQLIENFPTITKKVENKEDFVVHGTLDQYLFNEAINLILQKICNNEEWEQDMEVILSLADKINYTKNLANLSLLLTCNDLLKIKLVPIEKVKEMIDLGRSAKKQELITEEIIELMFDYLDNDDNLTPIRSFIIRILEIIPLKSEVRLIFYKKLFSRKPFELVSVIIEKIFITENQEKNGIFLTLIKDPKQALQHSIRLRIINNCFDIRNSDTNMEELCCDVIQTIFNEFEFKKLLANFKQNIEIFTNLEPLALQHITVIAFLKEFIFKFWKYILEDNPLSKSLIKEINDCINIRHPRIRSFKYNLLLQQKNFSIGKNQFKNLKNTFPWIEDQAEEIVYLPKFWRPIRKVKFEDFYNFYNNDLIKSFDKYLFLSVYFNQCEKLKLVRHLYPIVRFVKILNSKNEYNLTRSSAQTMTFNEFIAKESIDDISNGNYLKNLFEEFALGWNSVINYITQYQSKELPPNKPFMNLECPVIFGLIEQKDSGIYLCAILEFLIKLQNEFLDNVLAIPIGQCKSLKPIETWSNVNSKAYFVKSIKVAQAQYTNFIDHEWDEKIILRHSQRNLEQGGNTNFIFDLQQIETILVKELVYNKVYFEKEDNQFYLKDFSFKQELFHNSSRILFDIKKILPQEPIPMDKLAIILSYFLDKSINVSKLLFLFEIILSFIKELSINNNDILIIDFIVQWLKLSRLDILNYEKIFQEYYLKHIIELYELIEEKGSGSIIHNINDKFKISLTQQMKELINNCVNYNNSNSQLIPAKEFSIALKRFIYRFLLVDSNIEKLNLNIYFLDFTLNLWSNLIEEELIENKFPSYLLVSHACYCYIFLEEGIEKAEKEKQKNIKNHAHASRKINARKFKS